MSSASFCGGCSEVGEKPHWHADLELSCPCEAANGTVSVLVVMDSAGTEVHAESDGYGSLEHEVLHSKHCPFSSSDPKATTTPEGRRIRVSKTA